jgi:hypothetical protein
MLAQRGTSSSQAYSILNCRRLPGRLNSTETAILLGVQEHDVPVLISARLLNPLGKPAPNAPKYFAAIEIEEFTQDRERLSAATKALAKHWSQKNHKSSDSTQLV